MDLGGITGAVMLVARKGQIAFVEAQGVMDVEMKKPMTRDTVFRMARSSRGWKSRAGRRSSFNRARVGCIAPARGW